MKRPAIGIPENRCDLLLLAAFGPELAPLRAAFGGSEGDAMTARFGEVSVVGRTCGIGIALAAANAALHIRAARPETVVLLGTCGAYVDPAGRDGPFAVGDVVVSRKIYLVDPSALDGRSQFPDAMGRALAAAPAIVADFVARGVGAADIATTLAITVDDDAGAQIAAGALVQVEHLEAYGVAAACAEANIPFAAVLGVANTVGSRGRAEWRQNHRIASAAAATAALRWIEEWRPPSPTQGE